MDLQVRREKISERMKILQRLVPGCDKVQFSSFVLTLSFSGKNNAIPSLHLGDSHSTFLTVFMWLCMKIGNWKGPYVG